VRVEGESAKGLQTGGSVPGVKAIAMGYMRAHKRLRDVYSQAYALHPDKQLDEAAADEVWFELFETLNWLDALSLSPEGKARMNPDLAAGLKFVRGRVHHHFADAIVFRRDVLVFLGPPTMPGKSGQFGPLPVADWCWRLMRDTAGRGQPPPADRLCRDFRRLVFRRSQPSSARPPRARVPRIHRCRPTRHR
jgi:hypothetical protein